MKLSKYLKSNILILLLFIMIIAIINLMLVSFKVYKQAIIGVNFTLIIGFILFIVYDFYRRKKFYDKLLNDLDLVVGDEFVMFSSVTKDGKEEIHKKIERTM